MGDPEKSRLPHGASLDQLELCQFANTLVGVAEQLLQFLEIAFGQALGK